MMRLSSIILALSLLMTLQSKSQETKKVLDYEMFSQWKTISKQTFTQDGAYAAVIFNKQYQGDPTLILFNTKTNKRDTFERAKSVSFSPSSDFMMYKKAPLYMDTRAAKKEKKKKDEMPEDTAVVYTLANGEFTEFPGVKSSMLPAKENRYNCIALKLKPAPEVKDTTKTEEEKEKPKKAKKKEKKKDRLVVFYPIKGETVEFPNIEEFTFSEKGGYIAIVGKSADTINDYSVIVFNVKTQKTDTVHTAVGKAKFLAFDEEESRFGFLHHQDTADGTLNKIIWYTIKDGFEKENVIVREQSNYTSDFVLSTHKGFQFTRNEDFIFVEFSKKKLENKDDSLLDSEKYNVDVWHYQDKFIQPMQLKNLKREQSRSYTAVYSLYANKIFTVEDAVFRSSTLNKKTTNTYTIIYDDLKYAEELTWEGEMFKDVYLLDIRSGEKKQLLKKFPDNVELSPKEKFAVWYNSSDSLWYVYNVKTGKTSPISKEKVFTSHKNDMPMPSPSYGRAGFLGEDRYFLINTRYDIWKFDLMFEEKPVCITSKVGNEVKERYRLMKLDADDLYFKSKEAQYLQIFSEITKETGFALLDLRKKKLIPEKLIFSGHMYRGLYKPKKDDKLFFNRGNYHEYNDFYVADKRLKEVTRITDINPQISDYNWGTVELTKWNGEDGTAYEGLLFKPEDFDPNKKYPMIVYFYETYSDLLYNHWGYRPSRSTINFPHYVSNGYVVFIPDITYKVGVPGDDAMRSVISGTNHIVEMGFVDKSKIGIQGQSWGGYQVGYIVTRTDMYAAAMAGAPVSNMTSAYGGIRWGSGMSRQFQYEKTQSRLGVTMWDSLDVYLYNSPVFYADRITTPLLIMHNDNDGAVPYYQGIEYFMAMRRLNKPAWMLVYNREEHNLTKWPNRMDLTIRMMQFFDHYLKDMPAPAWMTEGRPALEKGVLDKY